jgi:hypothetical protein
MFLVINQNIHTQLCLNMKIHHHHINDLKLDYLIFLIYIFKNKYYLQKVAL